MTCKLCLKQTCRHQEPRRDENTALGRPRSDDPPSAGIGLPGSLSTSEPHPLFALTDRHELICTLCSHIIPNGCDQAYLRAYHGKSHVRRGEAVEDRRGLPEGAVRYLVVKSEATA